jgi:hypothetical protein
MRTDAACADGGILGLRDTHDALLWIDHHFSPAAQNKGKNRQWLQSSA